jgi:hypothetical protein
MAAIRRSATASPWLLANKAIKSPRRNQSDSASAAKRMRCATWGNRAASADLMHANIRSRISLIRMSRDAGVAAQAPNRAVPPPVKAGLNHLITASPLLRWAATT